MPNEFDALLAEVGLADDPTLRSALGEIQDAATAVRPVPNAELRALLIRRRRRTVGRTAFVTSIVVIGSLGAGFSAAAATPQGRNMIASVVAAAFNTAAPNPTSERRPATAQQGATGSLPATSAPDPGPGKPTTDPELLLRGGESDTPNADQPGPTRSPEQGTRPGQPVPNSPGAGATGAEQSQDSQAEQGQSGEQQPPEPSESEQSGGSQSAADEKDKAKAAKDATQSVEGARTAPSDNRLSPQVPSAVTPSDNLLKDEKATKAAVPELKQSNK